MRMGRKSGIVTQLEYHKVLFHSTFELEFDLVKQIISNWVHYVIGNLMPNATPHYMTNSVKMSL